MCRAFPQAETRLFAAGTDEEASSRRVFVVEPQKNKVYPSMIRYDKHILALFLTFIRHCKRPKPCFEQSRHLHPRTVFCHEPFSHFCSVGNGGMAWWLLMIVNSCGCWWVVSHSLLSTRKLFGRSDPEELTWRAGRGYMLAQEIEWPERVTVSLSVRLCYVVLCMSYTVVHM